MAEMQASSLPASDVLSSEVMFYHQSLSEISCRQLVRCVVSALSQVHVQTTYGLKGSGNNFDVLGLKIRQCVSAQDLWNLGYNICFDLLD